MDENPLDQQELVPPPVPESVWMGRYGLRAGWSILLFLVIIVGVLTIPEVIMLVLHTGRHEAQVTAGKILEIPPTSLSMTHVLPLVAALLASWLLSKVERRRMGVYGLGGEGRALDCVKGLITGAMALSLLVAILYANHLLVFDGFNVTGVTAWKYGLIWLAGFCVVGVSEEYLFRGYLQFTLTRGLLALFVADSPRRRLFAFWLSAVLLSVAFLGGHLMNPGESKFGLLAVFLAGIVLVYSLWRTGSLWWAIGFHATWDWAQSFLYGVGDSGMIIRGRLLQSHPQGNPLLSGGNVGPEGSVLFLGIFLLLLLTIRYTLPKRSQPPLTPVLPPYPAFPSQTEMLS